MMMYKNVFKILWVLLVSGAFSLAMAGSFPPGDSIAVKKIWDQGKHNAFTDLIRFNNQFYCAFREGLSHVGGKNSGKIRILKSKEGEQWESVALLEIEDLDLRDAKLSITPRNQLMVTMAGAVFEEGLVQQLFPMVSFSDKSGQRFSQPERAVIDPAVNPTKDWIWRVTWHKGVGYGIDYQLKENGRDRSKLKKDAWLVYLLKTTDGKYFEKVSQLEVDSLPNEATIRVDEKDNMYVLVRREAGDRMGVLAHSNYPYQQWNYNKLSLRLGGPNFLFLNKNDIVMGTRLYEDKTTTGILVTDRSGKVRKTIRLPSDGDTSYPGMLMYKNKLWVSYYSSHEGKSSIYLAQIPIRELEVK
ncbi:sialidase family protein [Nibrella saemangeumensis]|uniref:Sialidase family protein n=1 Tax=Nibrella saemangeumensis TaxID=1084526 RepID=A0ABP8NFR0_9BACT